MEKLNFDGNCYSFIKNEEVIFIKKRDIEFKDGYGLITYSSDNKLLRGLVTEKLEILIEPSEIYSNIKIFANNNFIVSKEVMKDSISNYHIHMRYDNQKLKNLGTISNHKYKPVDKNLVIIDEFHHTKRLYDIEKAETIGHMFTNIDDFKKVKGIDIAKATIEYNNDFIACYIDKKGQIRTPLYVSKFNEYIDVTEETYFDEVNKIEKRIFKYDEEDEVKRRNSHLLSLVK